MSRITVHDTIDAPAETVFAYVDDYRKTTKYFQGLSKWEPTTDVIHGKGSVFAVAMKAGPATLDSVVEITTWTENRRIGWTSTSGLKQKGSWAFTPKDGRTDATLDLELEFPGGIAGKVVARAAEPVVRMNLNKTMSNLKEQTERQAKRKAT